MADTWQAISGYASNNYSDTMVFEVDGATKKLQKISGQTLIAGEKNSQYIRFMMPRYWDGIDVSEKTISIIYGLAGQYYGETAAISAERTDDSLRFGWVVPEEACCIAGTLLFVLVIKDSTYVLKSQITEVPVLKSINLDDVIPEPTKETWYADFQVRVEQTLSAAENAVEVAQNTLEQARSLIGSPLVANTAEEMTDTSRIYVYTGSETGYTNGHWYYYNGSAWTDGGVYNSVAVDTDTTLSISGKAADAKKTGDEIEQIKEDFNDIEIDFYKNQFDKSKVTSGSYIRGIDGATITNASWNTSDYIPVWSGCIVLISKWYNSTTYGFAFYDSTKNQIYHEGLKERTGNVVAPENAKYIRVSVSTTNLDNLTIYVVPKQFYNSKALNPFYIQAPGEMINGNGHNAFPAICQFGGYEYVAFRSASQHDTTDSYGGVVIYRKEKNGAFVEAKAISTGDWNGELRDPSLSVTRNGRYMLLSCFTTYTVSDVTHHDNVIIQLDTNIDVVGRYIATDATYVYWGKTLETPTGHLLHAEYGSNKIILARSNEVFDGTNLSGLTFTETEWNNGSGMAEPDIGYNDKYLFLICRRGSNNAVYKKATDLEGIEGFDSSHSVGMPLHAPKLLAHMSSDDYMVYVGAMYVSSSVRKPVIAFYRVSDNTLIQYAVIKESTKNGAYIDFCKTSDHEYDVVWYDEPNLTTTTEINYEHLNLRECCPAINFIV